MKTLSGITFHVCDVCTVNELKEKIKDREGHPVEAQRLIFAGKRLEDGCALSDNCILYESTIHLLLRTGFS